jgi:hypothetical protein
MQVTKVPTKSDTAQVSVAPRTPRVAAVRHIHPDRPRRVWSLVPRPSFERK